MELKIFPIRHHGVGSAKALSQALDAFAPDVVLIEGAFEGNDLMDYVGEGFTLPVALLVYQNDHPKNAAFYPLAEYSPEWQALWYAKTHGIVARFIDIPHGYEFEDAEPSAEAQSALHENPIDALAEIAGFSDGVAWWDSVLEERQEQAFDAILAAMAALREHFPTRTHDLQREAFMRLQIKAAQKEGFGKIAVVCGAWHAPALLEKTSDKDDKALCKPTHKHKTTATWIAYSHSRLTTRSGYGAGIDAPRYYAHRFQHFEDDGLLWVAEMAQVLRGRGFEVSAAHMMEVWQLAAAAARLRGQARPYLADFMDALVAVVFMGEPSALALVREDLLVGERMGAVPANVPKLPLLLDLEQQHKALRLPLDTTAKEWKLDLRKDLDLQRSVFLHRLQLLGIPLGERLDQDGRGTFREIWRTQYQPEYHAKVADSAAFGNTLEAAVQAFIADQMAHAADLAELSALLERVLPADLGASVQALARTIEHRSADTTDLEQILGALKPLTAVLRYGTVRDFDDQALWQVLHTLLIRLEAGGALGAVGIDAKQAQALFEHIRAADYALLQLNDESALLYFQSFLQQLIQNNHVHAQLHGAAVRLLFEQSALDFEATHAHFSQAVSHAVPASDVAAWLDGFLAHSGKVLLLHEALWAVVFAWVNGVSDEYFEAIVPLLCRTFATFESGERRQLGEKVKMQSQQTPEAGVAAVSVAQSALDNDLGQQAMQTMAQLLGVMV